jgi:ABC-type transport system involved in multi-copper enzyme maturation permease subunit
MSLWSHLVTENPMMIETKRFARKFFGANFLSNWIVVLIIGSLLLTIYGMIYENELHYLGASSFALFLVTILVPILLHGAIAGERERRSWDMLLVAPVTKEQIVIGKFLGVALGIGAIVATLAVAIFVSDFPSGDRMLTGIIMVLIVGSFAYAVAGITMFVSSRSKRSMTALGVVYGCLFMLLLGIPMFGAAATMDPDALYLNPFYAVTQVNAEHYDYDATTFAQTDGGNRGYVAYGVAHVIIYVGLALTFLYLSTISLNSAGFEEPRIKRNTT